MPEDFKSSVDFPTISARHFVSFYQHPHYPVEIVCDYLAEGLSQGEAVVAVVTPEHAASITTELNTRGLRIDEMTSDGRFACADIAGVLAYLLAPKISRSDKHIFMTDLVEEAVERTPANRCRFLGELVSLMVAGGNLDNAFELEDSWNHLLANFPAMLYCMYEQTPFEQLQKLNHFCEICNCHDAVLPAHLHSTEEPTTWFVVLQEQAVALRNEVMRRRQAERLVYVNEANRLTQLEGLLRAHGPNLSPLERDRIVEVVTQLKAEVRKEKWAAVPQSPEWYKKTGEILGYEKVIARVLRRERKPNGDPSVS
jgi:hypothetical protein